MAFSIGRAQTRQRAAREISALRLPQPEESATLSARGISAEVVVLFLICTVDMFSSAWLFQHGLAVEGNPVLRGFAEAGIAPFMGAKLASFVPALFVAEWYRRIRPRRALPLLRSTIVGYIAIYLFAVLGQLAG